MRKNVISGDGVRRVLEEQAARLAALESTTHGELARLEQQLRVRAKGTQDMTDAARSAGVLVRIEVALRGPDAPMSVVELTRAVKAPAGRVQAAMMWLRSTPCATGAKHADSRCVFNHGTDTEPRWAWVPGDEIGTQELNQMIERMLRRRPYTFAELMLATGARRGRVSGAIVEFARGDYPIYTVGGNDRRYVWWIGALSALPAAMRRQAKPVKLAPDKNKV